MKRPLATGGASKPKNMKKNLLLQEYDNLYRKSEFIDRRIGLAIK